LDGHVLCGGDGAAGDGGLVGLGGDDHEGADGVVGLGGDLHAAHDGRPAVPGHSYWLWTTSWSIWWTGAPVAMVIVTGSPTVRSSCRWWVRVWVMRTGSSWWSGWTVTRTSNPTRVIRVTRPWW